MAQYKYTAVDQNGKRFDGMSEANSREHLMEMIRQRNLYPVSIKLSSGQKQFSLRNLLRPVDYAQIAIFCRQFYVMVKSGLEIIKCLDVLSKETQNKQIRMVIREAHEDVQKGLTLSHVLMNHGEVFPDLLIRMIGVGEVSGTLDTILLRMAVHYEKENRIRKKIQGAMLYPIVLGLISVTIIVFLLTFVMPIFVGLFTSSGLDLPRPTQFLLDLSGLLKEYWYLFIIDISAIFYVLKKLGKTETGRFMIDNFKLACPIIKTVNKKIIVLRFTRTLSMLLASGLPMIQALEVVINVIQNKKVEKELKETIEDVQKGISLADAIRKSSVFSSILVSMTRIGEESGSLDEILNNTADFYDDEVALSLEKLLKLLEPLMIIVMAAVIGGMVFAMILPMFDMFSTLKV